MFVFTDESAICERDLIRVYGRSPSNEPVTRWVHRSNPRWYSASSDWSTWDLGL
ncbi:hypothetical protein CROQUDRAFT_651462, partial [Cronartium quercuum f. sp. fusiforme G11]